MVSDTRVSGRQVSFRRESGSGPTLVCVHGSADNRHFYDRLLDLLQGVPRIAIDSPGRLGSEGPLASSVEELAAFVQAFVDQEVEGDYVLAGHSLGGAVVIERALAEASARLRGLVLLATGARLRVHPTILQIFEGLVESGKPATPAPGLFPPGTPPDVIEETARLLALTPASAGLSDWQNANRFDRMHDVAQISVPTLVMAGTYDHLTPPKYAEYLDTHIPTTELVVLEGAGHMFPVTRAPEVADAIRAFLAAV